MNECDLGTHNCSSKADCLNLEGSFKCKCIFGFTGDGSTCTGNKLYSARYLLLKI